MEYGETKDDSVVQKINDIWDIVKKTSCEQAVVLKPTKHRRGWKTIRIFVSSTFTDFYWEREVLVKEIFPDLRLWCEKRKLRLIECDLRWGVPKGTAGSETINICLSELDRCYEENVAPFFLNMIGERSGWIPSTDDLTENIAEQYRWVDGLSITEMEIVHGALRNLNPNALFMLRQLDFCKANVKKGFFDLEYFPMKKIEKLKATLSQSFPGNSVFTYPVKDIYQSEQRELSGLSGDSAFSKKVLCFFKTRIAELYPLESGPTDHFQVQKEAQETFLYSRSSCLLGRDELINKIEDYYMSDESGSPLLLVGEAGAGKSSLMARCACDVLKKVASNELKLPENVAKCDVFFHFVGATPGSTNLCVLLQRLLKELIPDFKDLSGDLERLMHLTNSTLAHLEGHRAILFIDATNQIQEDEQKYIRRWLPNKLCENVRVIVSCIDGSYSHDTLRNYCNPSTELFCGPLDGQSRKEIVSKILGTYNKCLDNDQLNNLVGKHGSRNPLWLTLACEEMRVHGRFETIDIKIQDLPDDLISLEMDMISRYESSNTEGKLVKALLCLLEVSKHGLLETELMELLHKPESCELKENCVYSLHNEVTNNVEYKVRANQNKLAWESDSLSFKKDDILSVLWEEGSSLMARDSTGTEGYVAAGKVDIILDEEMLQLIKDSNDNNANDFMRKHVSFLPARSWAIIYRNMKQLLRPCGDLGEGRLDFYHTSLSEAIRKMYFETNAIDEQHKVEKYWHQVLASYFENVEDMDRKSEELPYHLEKLNDKKRLIKCLLEWPVFNRLYSEECSTDLLRSWGKVSAKFGLNLSTLCYKESLRLLKESSDVEMYKTQMDKIAKFMFQAGKYEEGYKILEEILQHELDGFTCDVRVEKLADIYQLMANMKSKIYEREDAVKFCRKSNEYRKQLVGEEHEFKMALNNLILSGELRGEVNKEEAIRLINECIETFEKMNDLGLLAKAIEMKTMMNPQFGEGGKEYFDENEANYIKSKELCLRAYGKHHIRYCAICKILWKLYDENERNQEKYDIAKEWYQACMEVYGENHIETEGAKTCLGISKMGLADCKVS